MESVIEKDFGTGKSLRLPGYRLAGKTGTAQKVGSGTGKHVANFVGVVPADDPKAVVLVMVDSPSAGKYYGGDVAGPPFLEIAKAVVRRYAIPPVGEARR
jgi:cell division protein FtsI (penicillin-binding protein 3)